MNIVLENHPCWYELSWDIARLAILVRINVEFMRTAKIASHFLQAVPEMKKEFALASFSDDLDKEFGFDGAMQRVGTEGGFAIFLLQLPRVRVVTNVKCSACNGKGYDYFTKTECYLCEGEKASVEYQHQKAYAASATLTTLGFFLNYNDMKGAGGRDQLMTLSTMTMSGPHGGSLSGAYGMRFRQWLGRQACRGDIPEAVSAMQAAHGHMLGKKVFSAFQFQARSEDERGWLNMSCPGDACGINPGYEGISSEPGCGYNFSCHNVDTPAQQLTLVAGLAALHDRARREGA